MGTNGEYLNRGPTIPDLMVLSGLPGLVERMEPYRATAVQDTEEC